MEETSTTKVENCLEMFKDSDMNNINAGDNSQTVNIQVNDKTVTHKSNPIEPNILSDEKSLSNIHANETSSAQEDSFCSNIMSTNIVGFDNKEIEIQYNDTLEEVITYVKKNKYILSDSESDEEIGRKDGLLGNEDGIPQARINIQSKHRPLAIFDSDSESEDLIKPHDKSFTDEEESNKAVVYMTNTKGDIVPETNLSLQKSRLAMLCDSDSDEEGNVNDQNNSQKLSSDEYIPNQVILTNPSSKSELNGPWLSKKSARKPKPKDKVSEDPEKMTPKEALNLRKEIQSESQRMLREKNISLPYHKPKSHSLKEFLARRSKLASAITIGGRTPPSVAIKMSNEQLEIISKKIKEREKEVKEFYKSESESDHEDDDKDYIQLTDDNQGDNTNEQTKNTPDNANSADKTSTTNEKANDKDCEGNFDNSSQLNMETCIGNLAETNFLEKEPILNQNMITAESETSEKLPNQSNDNTNHLDSISKEAEDVDKVPESSQIANILDQESDLVQNVAEHKEMEVINEAPAKENESARENTALEVSAGGKKTDEDIPNHQNTMNYDFNLEGLEENTEKNLSETDTPEDNLAPVDLETNYSNDKTVDQNVGSTEPDSEFPAKTFTYTDLDEEIENFRTKDENCIPPPKSKLELIKERIGNVRPKLSGGPDEIIDLESGMARPKEVIQLIERFVKHTAVKKHNPKRKVQLSVVTVDTSGNIHKETVEMNVDNEEETAVQEEIPGAKLHKLKEELQNQMAQKKNEIWQQKAAKGIENSNDESADDDCVDDDEYLDDEEEAVMTDEDDSEEELDDIEIKDKPLQKSQFFDQEAEESEMENEDDEEVIESEDRIVDEEDIDVAQEIQSEDNGENSNLSASSIVKKLSESAETKKRVLKRILKPADDSDEEDLFNESVIAQQKVTEEFDSTITADEEEIPPHQPRPLKTPIRVMTESKSLTQFLTPISFITGLQNLNSANKGSAITSPFRMSQDPSSTEDGWSSEVQKKLFLDSEVSDSQASLLSTTQAYATDPKENISESLSNTELETIDEPPPSTQDLLGICSGEFTGVTQMEPSNENSTQKMTNEVCLSFGASQEEIKSLDAEQDMIISQLLDEEELENFKKKFESPVNASSQRSVLGEAQEVPGGGVIDSDDDDQDGLDVKKKKNNQKRLQFSDDESSEDEKDNEEIDLQDNEDVDDEEIDNIGYDSEENEVDLKEGATKKLKMTDFLEAEAELSESEWGSEDEDEKDLDKLEFELGDMEKFDENKVREDLEKIHMRRMLDDDTREVKLLQELLLEDGEMHGTGRQRNFKWKNIDLNDDQTEEKKDDDDIYLDEEESEEHWRKQRHEREMFLSEKQQKSQSANLEDDLLNHSRLLKMGHKILQRSESQNSSQNNMPTEKVKVDHGSPIIKQPFSLINKRGSFLSRSDQVLQRVAEYTKVTSAFGNATKTTKNFVFQSVSATMSSTDDKKRKASDGTPNVLKKLRLSSNFSPVLKKKLDKPERSKKLFNF